MIMGKVKEQNTLNVLTLARTNRQISGARQTYYAPKSLRAKVFTRQSLYAPKCLRPKSLRFRIAGMFPGLLFTIYSKEQRKFIGRLSNPGRPAKVITRQSFYAPKLLRAKVITRQSYPVQSYYVQGIYI